MYTLLKKILYSVGSLRIIMDCHATARGLIPGWDGVFTELHVLRKGQ